MAEIDDIVHSWKDALFLREEEDKNLGFRSVQVGTISAIKAHFISKPERKAIVVMPTGTGKTDVMIATMVGEQLKRTLILVPSAMLRHQIAEKFKSFGILKQYYLVKSGALMPLTEELKTWPKVPEDFFTNRNVLVATPSIFRGHEQELPYLVKDFEALFIDEAHHMPAQTWQVVGNAFKRKKIIQFTATPFRNDGKLLLGEIIFNYSLSLALKAGYFTEIDFEPIEQFDTEKEDADISSKAIELLRKDIAQGFDHKLLVRAKTMKRAAILYNEYYNISSTNDLCPVLITSNKSSTKPKNAVALYNEGKAKIVVAVDMFKEGIDDAKFKIGALHDKYKSLPVTLQFLGRLTRVEPCKLGHAKLVANLVNDDFIPELQDLYSEDTDWTFLLPKLSDYAITKRISFQQLLEEFNKKDETSQRDLEYVLAHFRPQFSMKVYSIPEDSFIPHNITNMNKQEGTIYSNRENTILLWVYTSQENIEWMPNSDCKNKGWGYYLLVVDNKHHLCYFNGSVHGVGEDAFVMKLIPGARTLQNPEYYYRVLGNLSHRLIKNVGLRKTPVNLITYQSFMGDAVQDSLSVLMTSSSSKVLLFGVGYHGNGKETVGASTNGRIWSFSSGRLDEFCEWACKMGEKITDDRITTEDIIRGTIIPKKKLQRYQIYQFFLFVMGKKQNLRNVSQITVLWWMMWITLFGILP